MSWNPLLKCNVGLVLEAGLLGGNPHGLGLLDPLPSTTRWHPQSSVFSHPGWCSAPPENFLLTSFPLYVDAGFLFSSAELTACASFGFPLRVNFYLTMDMWMARGASQKVLSLFSCFLVKETLACQIARQHTMDFSHILFLFFFFSRPEVKRWVTDFQWGENWCWAVLLQLLRLLHLSRKGSWSKALKPTAYPQSPQLISHKKKKKKQTVKRRKLGFKRIYLYSSKWLQFNHKEKKYRIIYKGSIW